MHAGQSISVCAACGQRVTVYPSPDLPPTLTHRPWCPRATWPVRDATRYDDDTAATILNWWRGRV